ncbi:MAG: hypothetical protein JSR37_00005 [Verrucomicrobia bacterium]|nr:hypothetical protein [Verrucomicrobiota bacterium]MBS0638115.1 hypothetical protein [Verrucomicrobiota bacterium]
MNGVGYLDLNDDIFDLLTLPPLPSPPETSDEITKEILQLMQFITSAIPKDQFEDQRRPLSTRIIKVLESQEPDFWRKNEQTLAETCSAFLNSVPPLEREQYLSGKAVSIDTLSSIQQAVANARVLLTKLISLFEALDKTLPAAKRKIVELRIKDAKEAQKSAELVAVLLECARQSALAANAETATKELINRLHQLDPSLLQKLSDTLKPNLGASKLQNELETFIKNLDSGKITK